MKRRETPEPRPNRRPWVRCTVDGSPYVFILPTAGKAKVLFDTHAGVDESDLAATEASIGAFLGACWDDEEWALESDPKDGAAVFEEFHRFGWGMQVCSALMTALANMLKDDFVGEEEVQRRIRFFGVKGLSDCTPSDSASNTSTTHGDGTG